MRGSLSKMPATLSEVVDYQLPLGDDLIAINQYIGQDISIRFDGEIRCQACDKKIKKSYFQGYCYPCGISVPQTAPCIINPELCEAHLGKGRDPEWEERYHNQPHVVYLAATSAIKVGITRDTQVPTRWIDQGAAEALVLARTPNRYLAGCIEVALKAHITDKTAWQAMLKGIKTEDSLLNKRQTLVDYLPDALLPFVVQEDAITTLTYPIVQPLEKVKSITLVKQPLVEGRLVGIRGQYLMFEGGFVFNVRNHTGYVVNFQA